MLGAASVRDDRFEVVEQLRPLLVRLVLDQIVKDTHRLRMKQQHADQECHWDEAEDGAREKENKVQWIHDFRR